jgi:hypothetical protein
MNADPTPTLMSIGRCFVGALHGPSDKATIRSPWSTGIPEYVWRHQANIAVHNVTRQLPTRRATQVLRTGTESASGHQRRLRRLIGISALPPESRHSDDRRSSSVWAKRRLCRRSVSRMRKCRFNGRPTSRLAAHFRAYRPRVRNPNQHRACRRRQLHLARPWSHHGPPHH